MGEIAAVVLVNSQKKLLLYLRDDKPSIYYPAHWALLGGHVEENETPLQALRRELKEEIDYEINHPAFLGHFDDDVGNICHIYKDSINKELNELVLTEGQRLNYFSFEDAIKLKLPPALRRFFIEYKDILLME